ncbi:MAG TPA: MmcQ/YjbR family DNA-binding protein [Vicinamibacterales bacterium]|nr:MmcQ/YjbR family DNA-binding protein [Vicinamibacterales bacterium]
MTPGDFKRLALGLEGAEQGSHMGAVDFRVGGRIFATLAAVHKGYGNIMLSPEQQRDFVAELPDVFLPVSGKWGEAGATHVRLDLASEEVVRGALHAAWKRRLAANAKTRRAPAPTGKRRAR